MDGLSFMACRRSATMPHVPAIGPFSAAQQAFPIDPDERDAACAVDAPSEPGPFPTERTS